ncbi:MAG: hypothetical protein A2W99_16525 [Bacteroidetes bacterium GWF2_33_16]|nr:MAG: hypothetical protein A2X00_14270 [Bacteroidetes bacterium GWE2_32_14]OFY03355.1 MAG: hypothetical protein A2W99_16525 [Bacteroidetes bacterium GWF2_33_16]
MKTIRITTFFLLALLLFKQAEGQYEKVNSNGLDIYYRIFGQGQPILIIGGGPGDVSDRCLSLCDLLSKNYQCILVDQRGTGKSAPAIFDSTTINIDLTLKDFEAIREQLGLKDWNVLGFSYGGFLASVYGEKYPSSISSLITLGSMGFDFSTFRYFSDNIMSKLWQSDLDALEYWSDSARYAADTHHAIVETIRAMMPGYFFDREKALIEGKNMKDSDFDFEMGNWIWIDIQKKYLDFGNKESIFNKPVLIIQGRQDPTGEAVAINNSNYYKNSTLVFVEKSGHYSWIEQPEKVLTAINEFLSINK